MYENKAPIYEILSGASIALAALLLIVPGFFSDLIGFLLLIPISRKILLKIFLRGREIDKSNINRKTIDGEIVDKDKDEL